MTDRFWQKVDQTPDCWLWTACTTDGYGRFRARDRKLVYAHRFAYELLVGPIPDGLTLDHLCRNRLCVNPDHLEPVTNRENILRGTSFVAQNARKTICPKGHPYDTKNTHIYSNGNRRCNACHRDRERHRRAARRSS